MRRADWVARLRQTVQTYEHEPYAYGINDCAFFAARCRDAITGSNWEQSLLYSGTHGAARFMVGEGGLEAGVTRRLGPPVEDHNAGRGATCLVKAEPSDTLGTCYGADVLVLSDHGVVPYPRSAIKKYWPP